MSSNGLGVVLTDLQRRVAALESQSGGGEELTPNYLTLTPGGLVGANFTGVINAVGLILPAAPGGPAPPQSEIAWETASGQFPITIGGISGGGSTQLLANAQQPSTTQQSQLTLQVVAGTETEAAISVGQGGGQQSALVEAIIGNPGGTTASVVATAENLSLGIGNQVATVIDQAGGSTFVQLLPRGTSAVRYMQAGNARLSAVPAGWQGPFSVSFPSSFPNGTLAVTYSLQPGGALSTIEATELGNTPSVSGFAIDINNNLAGQTITVFWIAVGY